MCRIQGQHTWLVTGAAGFIGMHVAKHLLENGQRVRAVDNFITGYRSRLDYIEQTVSEEAWKRFEFIEGDLTDVDLCRRLCAGADYVLHQAALGSAPKSIDNPLNTHRHNVDAFINIVLTAKDEKCRRFVFASSSSVYGDDPGLPKKEETLGQPLSPYAATKRMGEIYAHLFQKIYGIECIGLRYFNIFGPAQNPRGKYAAVIPLWVRGLLHDEEIFINGDGTNGRDFCYVENAIQANVLAALAPSSSTGMVYNIGCSEEMNLKNIFQILREEVGKSNPKVLLQVEPVYRAPRAADIQHSLASIEKARKNLGYEPKVSVREGLARTVAWFTENRFLFE
jgi:UDP-N-acetylglucosamine/UDP-N-acetylgalactosamine 4-epimerase